MDAKEGFIEIRGKSYPPDVSTYYQPVLDWLEAYKALGQKDINLHFILEYFNTASYKLVLDILYKLEEIDETGKKVTVSWYYPEDDEDILDLGEEYAGLVDLTFRHISYLQEF